MSKYLLGLKTNSEALWISCVGRPYTTKALRGKPPGLLMHTWLTEILHRVDVVEKDEIPAELLEVATAKRAELIEQLADVDDTMADLFLAEEKITTPDIVSAVRRATIARKFSPVFLGSAIKNTGIQPLLDGVCAYLPTPSEAEVKAIDTEKSASVPTVPLTPAAEAPFVGLAFKLEEGRFGQLTYMRVYQGTLKKGNTVHNVRTGKKVKVPRLVRMHSNEMEVRRPVVAWLPVAD